MSTKQQAQIYIKNNSHSDGVIQLYHNNISYGTQSEGFWAAAGDTVGPMTVYFDTGVGSYGIPDYWAVRFTAYEGQDRYIYANKGSSTSKVWKECQLQSADAGQSMTFSVDTDTFDINLKSGGCSNDMGGQRHGARANNVFVLMLENHSFDNMFALSNIPDLSVATTSDYNTYNGQNYYVQGNAPATMPTDPGHEFTDVVEQLSGQGASYPSGGPYPSINNSGFASNYATTTSEGPAPSSSDIGDVMKCFNTASQLPVIYTLATEFTICDHWFSSLPGPTWPNRFFIHGASSNGLDHSPSTAQMTEWETIDGFDYPNGSIFDALDDAKIDYRLYGDVDNSYSDDPQNGSVAGAVAQVSSLENIQMWDINSLSHFASDLNNAPYDFGYTFIEPNYGNILNGSYAGGSSQHPMDDTYGGENLIKAVYEAIRNSPLWYNSLLIVTYDEHGGFYDHHTPPATIPPGDGSNHSSLNEYGFDFKQLGIRVPAVVVSPWSPQGHIEDHVCEHSSALRALETCMRMGHLTDRDKNAHDVSDVLALSSVRTNCPTTLPNPVSSSTSNAKMATTNTAEFAMKPLPESGNLIGTLGAVLQAEFALSDGSDASRQALIDKFGQVKTYGQAEEWVSTVMEQVRAKAEEQRKAFLEETMPPYGDAAQ